MDVPHSNASDLKLFDGFRATFYLVTPSETVFEYASEVPDYVAAATPHFFSMILIEMAILFWKGQRNLRINDKLTSIGAGLYSEVLRMAGLRSIGFSMYVYVYKHYCLYELPWDSSGTWILMALAYDLVYYWFHRMAHEVNFFWNTHVTHHSSEDYALPTALRQSVLQTYASMWFYLPLALFVPPSAFAVHQQLNLLYQFWIHTELIDSLGPLEYIMNTPSHHRVHHGRNPYCIDKNYAAVLIIWDRMFGTFEAERKDEKIVYGLVHPVGTFDGNSIQFSHYVDFVKRCWEHKGLYNKLLVMFNGPGWTQGSPRLGRFEDIPKIEHPVKVYDTEISNWLTLYVLAHYLFSVALFNQAMSLHLVLPVPIVVGASVFLLSNLTCVGYIFDKRNFAYTAEFCRCFVSMTVFYLRRECIAENLRVDMHVLNAVIGVYILSTLMWSAVVFNNKPEVLKEKSA